MQVSFESFNWIVITMSSLVCGATKSVRFNPTQRYVLLQSPLGNSSCERGKKEREKKEIKKKSNMYKLIIQYCIAS